MPNEPVGDSGRFPIGLAKNDDCSSNRAKHLWQAQGSLSVPVLFFFFWIFQSVRLSFIFINKMRFEVLRLMGTKCLIFFFFFLISDKKAVWTYECACAVKPAIEQSGEVVALRSQL